MFSCLLNKVIYLHNQNFGAPSSGCTYLQNIVDWDTWSKKKSCWLYARLSIRHRAHFNYEQYCQQARGQNHSFESQVIPRLFPKTLTELSCVSKQIVFRAPMFHSLWESLYLSLLKSMWMTYWRACLKRFF